MRGFLAAAPGASTELLVSVMPEGAHVADLRGVVSPSAWPDAHRDGSHLRAHCSSQGASGRWPRTDVVAELNWRISSSWHCAGPVSAQAVQAQLRLSRVNMSTWRETPSRTLVFFAAARGVRLMATDLPPLLLYIGICEHCFQLRAPAPA